MAFFGRQETCKEMTLGKVIEYLDSQGWKYTRKGDQSDVIEFHMGLKCKLRDCRVVISVGENEVQAFAMAPIRASQENYADVVEFITRANCGLKVGKFEFDYRDGEVRFQSCLPCKECVPNLKNVETVVDIPMLMLQRYGDGLAKNLMGFGNPAADIQEIESK